MPGRVHRWPNRAACWSPATPVMGKAAPSASGSVVPNDPDDGRTSGNTARGTSKSPSISSDQSSRRMSKSMVRAAFVTSVAWTRPPVSFQISQLSTVPNASSPAWARSRAPSTWSRTQASLVPEKYGSKTSPVAWRTASAWPASASRAQAPAVRRSCHTTAG